MSNHTIEYLGVDHIGVAVNDLSDAEKTYRDILGFSISGEESLPNRGLEVRFVDTGNSHIELIGATREDSEISKFLETRGEGVHHICVVVRDVEATIADLTRRGASIIGGGVKAGAHGSRVAFIHPKGSHGVLIELVEHRKDG